MEHQVFANQGSLQMAEAPAGLTAAAKDWVGVGHVNRVFE